MRVDELHHEELLELDPNAGTVRFAGQRALILDAVAMGVLRHYLVQNFGETAARAVLTQFGFAHGWRMAEALRTEVAWAEEQAWFRAGPRLCSLQGLFRVQPGAENPLAERGAMLVSSYEAEQHLLHFGRADTVVCWTVSGLMSGYLSHAAGEEVYVLEHRCVAAGHTACHLVGRSRDAWGEQHAEDLAFFDQTRLEECLEVSLTRVTETLRSAEKKLRAHRRALARVAPDIAEPLDPVSRSPKMRLVVDLARRVAAVDATVLITGESGVGKERIARLIHDESPRAAGPFIPINCGALSEMLLESELFGHRRGAFTGAAADRHGLFEAANGGTLLLDEIAEVSPSMQVKLLRVLQEREVRRVGDNQSRPVDVRILASTNRDLSQQVAAGRFRQDLYYRLKVVVLTIPPLCERVEDVLPLARLFLADASVRMGRTMTGLTPEVADLLVRYSWPGNVRELENTIERAVALARGARVELADLPEEIRDGFTKPVASAGSVQPLREVEREYILAALELNEGHQRRTAAQLGIGTATLYRKLKSYGLIRPRRRRGSGGDAPPD